jgi:hypothetical protein
MSARVLMVMTAPDVIWTYTVNEALVAGRAVMKSEGVSSAHAVSAAIRRDVPWGDQIGRPGVQIHAPGLWQFRLTDDEAFWLDGVVVAARLLSEHQPVPGHDDAYEMAIALGSRISAMIEEQVPALRTASIEDWADRFTRTPA